jgi:hypothetical protein
VNFMKTVQKVKEVMNEEIVSGNDNIGSSFLLSIYCNKIIILLDRNVYIEL